MDTMNQFTVYVAEKYTFLEFVNDESMVMKGNACTRSASADALLGTSNPQMLSPDTTPRWRPGPESSNNQVIIPNLKLPIPDRSQTIIPNAELPSPDSTPRWCPGYQYQDAAVESSSKNVILPKLKLPSAEAIVPNNELQSPDSTPRWNSSYQKELTIDPTAGKVSPDSTPRWHNNYKYDTPTLAIKPRAEKKVSPDSTPRWHNHNAYKAEKNECSDKKIAADLNAKKASPDSTPRDLLDMAVQNWRAKNSLPQSWADQSEDVSTPDATPRWNDTCEHDDANKFQMPSAADQNADLLTPETTPRWSNVYGHVDANKSQMASAAIPMYNVARFMPMPMPMSPVQAQAPVQAQVQAQSQAPAMVEAAQMPTFNVVPPRPPSEKEVAVIRAWQQQQQGQTQEQADLEAQKQQAAEELAALKAQLEAASAKLAAVESHMIKPCSTTGITAKQEQPESNFSKMATCPAENEKALTISLDLCLLEGLRQSAGPGRRTDCASFDRCPESRQGMQPNMVNTGNKRQELKKSKKSNSKKGTFTPSDCVTTLMMRGIPCGITPENLMSVLNDAGLKGKYDFFYLPMDVKKNANLGYAFINFVNVESAESCVDKFKGIRLAPLRSLKTCSFAPATVQGLANLSEQFKYATAGNHQGPVFLDVSEKQ